MAKNYQIVSCTDIDGISRCASLVKAGGVIVFPTDTIYGIGCDPYNDSAVARIFRIKRRDEKKPLPLLTYSIQDAEKIVLLGRAGRILTQKFWPGALTIVASVIDHRISPRVAAGNPSLAVRMPANNCILSLLKHTKFLVGTSANLSGKKSLKSAREVIDSPLNGFDVLLDGGAVVGGIASTIIDIVAEAKPLILREGAIKSREVMDVLDEF
jgi:L-threonylcarbamoyladenylate synthase